MNCFLSVPFKIPRKHVLIWISNHRESCSKCCQPAEEEEAVVKKFAKARLEICTCKFGAYPQIQGEFHEWLPTFTINNKALLHFIILNRSFLFQHLLKVICLINILIFKFAMCKVVIQRLNLSTEVVKSKRYLCSSVLSTYVSSLLCNLI